MFLKKELSQELHLIKQPRASWLCPLQPSHSTSTGEPKLHHGTCGKGRIPPRGVPGPSPGSNTGSQTFSSPCRGWMSLLPATSTLQQTGAEAVPGSEIIRLWSEGSRRNSLQVSRSKLGRIFFWHSSLRMLMALRQRPSSLGPLIALSASRSAL